MRKKCSLISNFNWISTGLKPVATGLFIIALFALCPPPSALSQIPQGFNYQAIARDGSGNPISSPINVKIAILSSITPETVIWEEQHTGVDPDDHGLFSIVVGQGSHVQGLASFSLIDWTVTPKYIRTKINETTLGTAQLWSVPYAMVADSLGGPLSKLKVKGASGSTFDEALFEVKNKTGQTVFAVYNEGVRVYVDNGAKGAKGGFSVGGFGTDLKAGESQPLLVVNKDSIRAYVYDDPALKAPKGGFSVGGFNAAKGITNEYLMVSPDCVRVYIDNAPSTKGAKGGFSVGGFDAAKGETQKFLSVSIDSVRVYIDDTPGKGAKGGFSVGGFGAVKGENKFLKVSADSTRIITTDENKGFGVRSIAAGISGNYLRLTPENYFIGHNSGILTTPSPTAGKYNSFLGFQTGLKNVTGQFNTFLGYEAGMTNTGSDNTFIGYKAGRAHKDKGGNVYIGSRAGEFATKGEQNVLIGESVGSYITSGKQNIMMGVSSGNRDTSGSNNVFLGYNAGMNNTKGNSNVIVGNESGANHYDGNFNTFIGYQSGFNNYHAERNVFLGYQTGYQNDGYNNVFIGYKSGKSNIEGHDNVFMGSEAGFTNSSGLNNVFIGAYAGKSNTTGGANIFMGLNAGLSNVGGSDNLFFGSMAGNQNTNGSSNIFMGYRTGYENETGIANVFIGYDAGDYGTAANNNVMIGKFAGFLNQADSNIYIGAWAGYGSGSGTDNIFIGSKSGFGNSAGKKNIIVGYKAGYQSAIGENNVFLGTEAGYKNYANSNIFIGNMAGRENLGDGDNQGAFNIFLGNNAGLSNTSGSSNIFIGLNAGKTNTIGGSNTIIGSNAASGSSFSGTGNVIIGNSAGSQETTILNKLIIDNSGTLTPLIWGDFTDGSEKLAFFGKVGIGTNNPAEKLEITGTDPKVLLNGSGSNMVSFNDQGQQIPSYIVRSPGTKLLLRPDLSGVNHSDYALGTAPGMLWYSVPVNDNSNFHRFYGGTTTLMTIRGDGNIGFGTDNPGQKLEIGGIGSQIFLNSITSNMIRFNQQGNGIPTFNERSPGTKLVLYENISASSADYAIGYNPGSIWYSLPVNNNAYSHNFYGGTEVLMTIRGDKRAGIGTANPAYNLDVTGNGRYTSDLLVGGALGIGGPTSFYDFRLVKSTSYFIASFENTGGTNASEGINILAGSNTGGATGANFIQFTKPGDMGLPDVEIIGKIQQDGSDAVKYTTTSDRRRKENIVITHFGVADLLRIKVHDFEFISDPEDRLYTGFIAQELFEVYPNAVSRPADENDLWQVDYGRITPLIVKAVQDQQYMIESLLEENRQLKAQNNDLEQRLERIEKLVLADK